jgi:hypothetical protein
VDFAAWVLVSAGEMHGSKGNWLKWYGKGDGQYEFDAVVCRERFSIGRALVHCLRVTFFPGRGNEPL